MNDRSYSDTPGDGELGEPATGTPEPVETNPVVSTWVLRSSPLSEQVISLLIRGVSLATSAFILWMVLPDDLKYEVRKQLRWPRWAIDYAAWWLRQEGF